jgi:hypothetical protein
LLPKSFILIARLCASQFFVGQSLYSLPCPIKVIGSANVQIKMVPTDDICMLGVPMGVGNDTSFSGTYVQKKLEKTSQIMTTLAEFEDVQSAFFLLRTSYNITRATHFMRTTPLHLWHQQAVDYDLSVRDTAEKILGTPFSEWEYRQAATSAKVGGLNIRQCELHAGGAYSASRFEEGVVAGESWYHSPPIHEIYKNQSEASIEIDLNTIERLKAQAGHIQVRLLERLKEKHAGAWLSAPASYVDGADLRMAPQLFVAAVNLRLFRPVLPSLMHCPLCQQPSDIQGIHCLSCKKGADKITRHNRSRDVIWRIAKDGLLDAYREKAGILGDVDGKRPGDVSIGTWSCGKSLAIDVAVICPLNESNMKSSDPAGDYAFKVKHKKYGEALAKAHVDFAPVIFETCGGLNSQGEKLIKQLCRFAAKAQGERYSSYTGRAWRRLSVAVQSTAARQILNRRHGLAIARSPIASGGVDAECA